MNIVFHGIHDTFIIIVKSFENPRKDRDRRKLGQPQSSSMLFKCPLHAAVRISCVLTRTRDPLSTNCWEQTLPPLMDQSRWKTVSTRTCRSVGHSSNTTMIYTLQFKCLMACCQISGLLVL